MQLTELLETAGAHLRGPKRADCPQCGGKRTVSFTAETYFCHHADCGWSGNTVMLVRELRAELPRVSSQALARRRIVEREADRVRRFARMRGCFLRDLNWLLLDIEQLARTSGQEHVARGGPVPESVWASLEWSLQEQKKLWSELVLFSGPQSGSGEPERWTRILVERYRRSAKEVASMDSIERQLDQEAQNNPALLRKWQAEHAAMDRKNKQLMSKISKANGRPAAADWPDPLLIDGDMPPVEPFSDELLPASFRPLVQDVSERMQVPIDYPATAIVLCLAGAVNRRAVIQPKAHDASWVVVPNLWGGIIAPPGFMKSPVIQAITRPLNQIQSDWRKEHEEELKEYARAKEEYDLRRAAWRDQFKQSAKKGRMAPERPEDEPEEPTLRRLIVNDATFEAMHRTMSENPAGIFVIRDELTGWWSTLDRAGREGERAFCLQAWNGDTGHIIDRIGRGMVYVEACCMSMLGGIQPGRLRSYLVDALEDGPSNDGLIQRFQLLVWPDTDPDWEYIDRTADPQSEETAAGVFRKLVEWDSENPKRFRFAAAAQELFIAWLLELEPKIRSSELHPALVSHLSKYRSLLPSLAVLFELADQAAGFGSGDFVSLDHAKQAAAWCDYLESHAKRVYSCVTTPQIRAARELAAKIKARKIGADGTFTCREVYFKGWSGLDTPEAVKEAAEVLEDAGWLQDLSGGPNPLGGRPSNRYAVNPKVWQ